MILKLLTLRYTLLLKEQLENMIVAWLLDS